VLPPFGRDTKDQYSWTATIHGFSSTSLRPRNAHLFTLRLAAVSPHNQIVCLLADVASYFSSVTFNQRLGLISFNTLQNACNYECQAFQAVFSSLRTRASQKMPLSDAIPLNTSSPWTLITPFHVKYPTKLYRIKEW